MSRNNIADLLERYQRNQCTPEEKARVDQWFEAHGMGETRFEQLSPSEQDHWTQALFADIQKAKQPQIQPLYRRLYPYAAAASVILLISAGILFFRSSKPAASTTTQDVAPYTAQAILKTKGQTILLDQTQNGKIAQTLVTKAAGEQLVYETASQTPNTVYDTIQIPKGGRPYTVKLADGTKLTLNAATTVRYPESFMGGKRDGVELITGEIYAEVKHNPQQPFSIKAPGQLIQDIGTEFNISAYPDESDHRTTLIEGAVKVNDKTLKPGQQAILTATNISIGNANTEQTTAWKNGDFYFNGEHLDVIMRQLARWYNIEVRYEGKMTTEVFYGKVTRKKNLSTVLKMLEKTQKVHFKIEGRRVTVLAKN